MFDRSLAPYGDAAKETHSSGAHPASSTAATPAPIPEYAPHWRSAITGQLAPLQRFGVGRLKTRLVQYGEGAPDLRKLLRRVRFLWRKVGPFRQLFAMVAQRMNGVKGKTEDVFALVELDPRCRSGAKMAAVHV